MQNAQLRRQTVPQQAQQAPRPQAKATTRPQQWLKASPRPQQWLLIGVPGCRLTGLKRSKRSKPSKSPPSSAHSRMQNAQLRRQKVPQQAQQAPRRSKRSKPSKRPPSSAGKRYPNKPNTRHSRLKRSKRSKPSTCPPSSAGKRVGGTRALAHSIYIWLVVYLPLWKIWVRQLGWWHLQLNGKNKKPCSKPPTRYIYICVCVSK